MIGSQNSSNSVRLTEISKNVGTPAKLIDDRSEIQDEWFDGVETVLITAGASAPEDLVNDLVLYLIDRFGGEVEQRDIDRESISFGLPGSLKQLMRSRGLDPKDRKITVDGAGELDRILDAKGIRHRTVGLTIGASN